MTITKTNVSNMRTVKKVTLCAALFLTPLASHAHIHACPSVVKQAVEQTEQKDNETDAKINALLDKALAAFKKDNSAEAIKCLEEAGKLGSVEAFEFLGTVYWRGVGVEKDMKKCFEYNLRAADLGSVGAQGLVATLYKTGTGTTQDMKKCVEYYKLAEKSGNPEAAYQLGCLYYRGQGIKQDYDEATRHFRIASDQGHAGGQYELGMMYSMGRGTEVDKAKSKELLQKSAAQGYQMAIVSLRLQAQDEKRKK